VSALITRVADAVKGPAEKPGLAKYGERYTDSVEPSTLVLMRTLDKMFGRSTVVEGFVPPPEAFRDFKFGGEPPKGFSPQGATPGVEAFGGGKTGRSIEAAIRADPMFKSRLEKNLGGSLVGSGTQGQLRVYDGPPPTTFKTPGLATNPDAMNAAARANHLPAPNPQLAPVQGTLQNLELNVRNSTVPVRGNAQVQASTTPMGQATQSVTTTAQSAPAGSVMRDGAPPVSGAMQKSMASGGAGTGAGGDGQRGQQNLPQSMQSGQEAAVGQVLSDTMKQQMLQNMMSSLNRFYTQLSNILSAMNSMQKTAIDNIK